jgi:hypothetical protein
MYVMKIGMVDGTGLMYHNIVFLPENPKITDQNLGRIYDSFGIPVGEMDPNKWKNKVGAARIKHEPYTGKDDKEKKRAAIDDFLTQERQEELGFVTRRVVEEGVLDLNGEIPF